MTTSTVENSRLAGYIELIRGNRNFRLLWFGQIVSLLGDWFDLIASASLVAALTGSGGAIGGLFAIRMIAPFVVSPLAGVLADRVNRKFLLVATDILRAITVLGFLLVRDPSQVWLLYVLTFIQLALSGIFFPARSAILPDIVSRRELGAANAITAATWSIMLAFGAALGGLAAGAYGIYPSFVIDSATFVVSAVILLGIRAKVSPPLEGAAGRSIGGFFTQYVDGLRYLRHHADILFISMHKAMNALFVAGVFQVVQVAIAERVFVIGEGGSTGLGLIYAAIGIGTGLGPIFARIFTGDRDGPMRFAIITSYGLSSLGLLIIAPLFDFNSVLLGALIRGVGAGLMWVFSTQLLLQLTPDHVRGRVFATEFAMLTLASAIGSLAGGWALDQPRVTIAHLLWIPAVLNVIPGVLWAIWVTAGKHRHTPSPEAEEAIPAK